MAPALEVHTVSKRFGSTAAVREVSFAVEPGEIFGLLGPNGAGKSTTLRLIAGLARPDAGSVRIAGHPLSTASAQALGSAGFLIESPAFPPELTCRETLRYLGLMGGAQRPSQASIDAALAEVGLTEAAAKTFRQLSLGMRQRLGIAAALFGAPRLIVLDEPLNGLDPAGIREMSELMRSRAAAGAAILLSSHLLDEVERTAHRVAVMNAGQVVAIDRVTPGKPGAVAELFFALTTKGAA
jgi:ABC-2 type transport system ATP-binding protein